MSDWDEEMYRSCISRLYWTGALDVLDDYSLSTLELALLSFACEYPHTIRGMAAWFSRWPEDLRLY